MLVLTKEEENSLIVVATGEVKLPTASLLPDNWSVKIKKISDSNQTVTVTGNLFVLDNVSSTSLIEKGSWLTVYAAPAANKFYCIGSFLGSGNTDLQNLLNLVQSLSQTVATQGSTITSQQNQIGDLTQRLDSLGMVANLPVGKNESDWLPTEIVGDRSALLGNPSAYLIINGKRIPAYD